MNQESESRSSCNHSNIIPHINTCMHVYTDTHTKCLRERDDLLSVLKCMSGVCINNQERELTFLGPNIEKCTRDAAAVVGCGGGGVVLEHLGHSSRLGGAAENGGLWTPARNAQSDGRGGRNRTELRE